MLTYLFFGGLALVLVGVILTYNTLVQKAQMARNGWSDIDVQLKRRATLIPQLVSTVQGYAAHERQLFADVAEKRAQAMAAGDDPASRAQAESALSQPVARMMALAEDYPELKASGNFADLQKELSDTETKIEMARRFYNGAVRELNTAVQTFPANLFAGLFGFRERAYFEIEIADRAVPQVDLGGKR
ncbi:LemA family protein [Hyphomonas sp.]|jgi:LemA protein|uniref:LemA family protein n=1 Tax=Hyphomonas sp. TaxID=87 RepID=UPI0025C5526B|nr:LemA family protein [Hyphomonas sp.]MBI1401307.1 LemA family protein [Hyphomonas sp.]